MEEYWARLVEPSGQLGSDYWNYFAERMAALATIPKDAVILDIGTYDGNVLLKALKKTGRHGFGVGIDIYEGGFQDGLAEAKKVGWEEFVSFVHMDANALGFPPDTFHAVLSNFVGWDHCFDFKRMAFISSNRMMSEIMSILKPGGQIGIVSWIEQCDIEWFTGRLINFLPEKEKQELKGITCYGVENPEGQKVILQSAGFKNIRVKVETTSFISPDMETWWRQMKQAANSCFRKVSDPKTLERFKERVQADLQQFKNPEGIRFSKTISIAFGTKPK